MTVGSIAPSALVSLEAIAQVRIAGIPNDGWGNDCNYFGCWSTLTYESATEQVVAFWLSKSTTISARLAPYCSIKIASHKLSERTWIHETLVILI